VNRCCGSSQYQCGEISNSKQYIDVYYMDSKNTLTSKSKSKTTTKSPNSLRKTRKVSPRRIKSLEKKVGDKKERTSNYLKIMCKDPGECLGFGRELDKLYDLFDGYNMQHALFPIRLLSKGANGFVVHIAYYNQGYVSYAILKNALKPGADNLMYEAFVGLNYINQQTRYFPCFLETYSVLRHKTKNVYKNMMRADTIENIDNLDNAFEDITKQVVQTKKSSFDLKHACSGELMNAILIEYIPQPILFNDYLNESLNFSWKIHYELPAILLQIYAVLDALKFEFTHYDLHTKNVALYEIPNDKYIYMVYHLEDRSTVRIPTQYIAKIMDYGRSYCPSSDIYYNEICDIPECSHDPSEPCGRKQGHRFFVEKPSAEEHYISTLDTNISHDLRLASIVRKFLQSENVYRAPLENLLNDVKYEGSYGTPEISCDSKICDVEDMFYRLIEYIKTPGFSVYTNRFDDDYTLEGTMDIYLDRSKELRFTGNTRPDQSVTPMDEDE
jgi:hypothetical protein